MNASQEKQALLAIRKLRERVADLNNERHEPIAILGMGCRFPGGADTPGAFWELLRAGTDAVCEIPSERWNDLPFGHEGGSEQRSARWAALMDDVSSFDAGFFSITAREAISLDPQQRLLLEVAWEALERAAIAPVSLAGSSTGVFVGTGACDYRDRVMAQPVEDLDAYALTGCSGAFASGRLSYLLGLHGPSFTVDTVCSSSLVAIHLACQSLRRGECSIALAGGVNVLVSPTTMLVAARTHALSPDGRSKTFDASANGFVRGEGCGIVVLKRLADAVAAGDRILGIIRGSAVNHDGRSNGLTAPNVVAQEAVLRAALADAVVDPARIGYIEAHGTGTSLGDPIEFEALRAVFGAAPRCDGLACVLGSVKTNIGHLEAAAGVASLIKTVLALNAEEIPRLLHFRSLNPRISLDRTPFAIPTDVRPWPRGGPPRMAGISSFGMSGTNAHMIVEEAPPAIAVTNQIERPRQVLVLSAKTERAVNEQAIRYTRRLEECPEQDWADVCHTAATGRSHFEHRLAVVSATAADAASTLRAIGNGPEPKGAMRGRAQAHPRVAFLFTGQGSQSVGMGRQLFETQPVYRAALERCRDVLRGEMDRDLFDVMFEEDVTSPLDETGYAQPALFAVEYALLQLWRSWGIEPAVVLGHSIGEYAAAYAAGVMSDEEALKLVAARGRLMQALPHDGEMVALRCGEERVAAALKAYAGDAWLAAVNGPADVVISGRREAVRAVCAALDREGIQGKPLRVSHAFHSGLMDPMLDAFERAASAVRYERPHIPLVSNVTGAVAGDEIKTAAYWRRQLREPVRFGTGVRTMVDAGCNVFVELGPHPALLSMASAAAGAEGQLWLPSLRRGRVDWDVLLESLAQLYVAGAPVDWSGFDRPYRRRRVDLPTYPWQHQRYWIEQPSGPAKARTVASVGVSQPDEAQAPAQMETGADARPAADTGYELAWRPRPRCDGVPADAQTEGGSWLILADAGGLGRALADCLEAGGRRCLVVEPFGNECSTSDRAEARRVKWDEPEEYARLVAEWNTPPGSLRGIVHLWGLDVPSPEADVLTLRGRQRVACESTVRVLQALLRHAPAASSRVWIVTRDAVAAAGNEVMIGLWQSVLWGLARVIALEHPALWGGVVDLPQCGENENPLAEAAALAAEILDPDGEDAIALRDSMRLVPRLVRRPLDRDPIPVRSDATYLITGGFGSLGLEAARWLLARGARDLVLVGRRGAATPEAQRAVAALEAAGARIRAVAANVANASAMSDLIDEIRRGPSPLRGIFHAAGTSTQIPITKLEPRAIAETLESKVDGTWVLDRLTRGVALDFFICCSSIASVWGSRDLAAYAAANHFLDSFAHYRRALGLPALAVNWGPIKGSDAITAAGDVLARIGLATVAPDDAFRALDRLWAPRVAQALVARVDWPLFRQSYEARGRRPLLGELSQAVESPEAGPVAAVSMRPALARIIQEQTRGSRRELIVGHLLQEVQPLIPPGGPAIDPQRGLFEQGMDSLGAIDLARRLTAMLGVPVPTTVIFEHPTVDALAEHLLGVIDAFTPDAQGRSVAPPPSVARSATPNSARAASEDGIAIVGIGCRFPGGADDPDAFWDLLWRGVDGTCDIPQGRWNVDEYFDPEPGAAGKMYVRRGGFLGDVAGFDHDFFGISPREAARMDPQQRLLLEVASEALERAGLNVKALEGSQTGVFVGVSGSDYARHLAGLGNARIDPYFVTGNALNAIPGRLCYILGLQGPAMAVDTACSSSLVALHLACQALRTGDCDTALACGVNLMLCPDAMVATSQAHMLSPDGRCKTFDASADGYARGEGCGVVVLKRLADALADHDRVHAVVRGSAVNHDGASSGFTVPNGAAQQAVIARALAVAGIEPREIAYVETHGTGTVLGDPIELAALASALGEGRSIEDPLLVGAVKTNIGHLESAAGIASVIKVALSLSRGLIPPHLHLRRPNPHFAWDKMPVAVAVTGRSWPANKGRCLAGVSSFGLSGTNAHAVLEAPPAEASSTAEQTASERPCHVLSVSGRTAAALEARIAQLSAHLEMHPGLPLADLCYSSGAGRSHFEHRLALVAGSTEHVRETLAAMSRGESPATIARGVLAPQAARPKVAFVFTGQGSQYVGMGLQLYQSQPVFRAAIEQCREALRGELPRDLLEVMFEETGGLLDETLYAQPALFAIEHALVNLWRAWGVEPAAVLGHSVGEYVAASVAGVMGWKEALRLVAVRGRLMQASPAKDGEMVALRGSEAQVSAAVAAQGEDVWVAAVNGPEEVVISGRRDAVRAVCAALERAEVSGRALRVSHAFHSGLLDPILAPFEEAAAKVSYAPPRIALVSNITGTLAGAEVMEPSYWRRQIREPVRFGAGVETLVAAKCEILIEVGPHPALMSGSESGAARERLWVPSLRRGRDDWATLLTSVARLYVAGVPIDWVGFDRPYARRRLELPTYPWQREQHWIDVPSAHGKPSAALSAEPATDGQGRDFSALTTVWRKVLPPVKAGAKAPGRWLVIGDDRDDVAAEVSAALRQCGQVVVVAGIGGAWPGTAHPPAYAGVDDFRALLAHELRTGECQGVVLMANLVGEADDVALDHLTRAQRHAYRAALHLVQAFDAVQLRQMPRLWLVTRGVEAVGEPLLVDVRHAALAGFARTVACEYPALRSTRIDLPLWPTVQEVDAFVAELLGDDAEDEVALRATDRFVPRLVEDPTWQTRAHDRSQIRALSADASYLLTGGLGGVGCALARWMVEQGARHLIIASRNEPSPSGREAVASLEATGACVTLVRADVADSAQVVSLLEACSRSGPALRGIVHLAGVLDDGLIAGQTLERFDRVMKPKAHGAWNLHCLTQHLPLEFFVMYSSLAGVVGSAGQANYAAANAFLDALAHRRRALGLPAVSLDWGPFGDAGMAAEHLRLASARDWAGAVPFSTARGASLFGCATAMNPTQVTLLPGPASAWLSLHPRWNEAVLFSELRGQGAAAAPPGEDFMAFRDALVAASADERRRLIGESIQAAVARSLGMDISSLDPRRPLSECGLDSLAGMEIKNRLERTLAVRIPIATLLQGGSVEDLSLHVVDAFVTEHLLDSLRAGNESPVGGAEWEIVKL
jgi:acyl transferase domain-containing protein/acyl carrier protein